MNGGRNMQVTKEIVSVSEMARMLGFSRTRIYQLIHDGVLPKPTKTAEGSRPFFTREQQEQCIEVRRTNRGVNGQAILFYSMRVTSTSPPTTPTRQPRRRSAPERPRRSTEDSTITDLRCGLRQLGLTDATEQSIRAALADLYPDGHAGVDSSELLRSIFVHLNRQDSHDNVSR